MPYLNIPQDAETQSKMERCVAQVQSEGYDKEAAIAICYTSIMGKEGKGSGEIDLSPPEGVRASAMRGLELRREFGRGGTPVGIARARTLSNGENITPKTARRMYSFFARHAVDRKEGWSDPSNPTNGYIAHMLWGGDEGKAWATKLVKQLNARDNVRTKAEEGESGGRARSSGQRSLNAKPSRSSRSSGSANWGARAGQTIRGNLARGADGKFTSAGNASAKAPAKTETRPKRERRAAAPRPKRVSRAKAPEPKKGRRTGEGSRGGKTAAQRGADQAKRQAQREAQRKAREAQRKAERDKRKTEQASERDKRKTEQEKRKAERDAARQKREQDRQARQQSGGKGGGKGSEDAAQSREGREAQRKQRDVYKAIDRFGEGKELSASERKLLLDEGLIAIGSDGKTVLTDKGRQVMAQEAADDRKKEFARTVGGGVDLSTLKNSDFAIPSERKFPIVTPKDVEDAVSSWGRYRGDVDFETFKSSLMALARRKGQDFVDRLPASWQAKQKGSISVFKQADGRYRWVGVSSNPYRDRDGEIVSTKALEADVARTDADGKYGPLRWWHVGAPDPTNADAPWGPGLDIGTCDFAAMHGRLLVESGVFKDAAVAEAVARGGDIFQMSLGFAHRKDDPDADGVFHWIHRLERSILPRGRAANAFTPFVVLQGREGIMLKEKLNAFAALMGLSEAQVEATLTDLSRAQKEADEAGIAYKAADDSAADGEMPDEAMSGEESEESEAGEEPPFVGDMYADEFMAMLTAAIAEAMQPLLGQLNVEEKMAAHQKSMADMVTELKSMMGGYAKKEAAVATRVQELEQRLLEATTEAQKAHEQTVRNLELLTKELQEARAQTAALEDDVPAIVRGGYRASQAEDTLMQNGHRLKGTAPYGEDPLGPFLRTLASIGV